MHYKEMDDVTQEIINKINRLESDIETQQVNHEIIVRTILLETQRIKRRIIEAIVISSFLVILAVKLHWRSYEKI